MPAVPRTIMPAFATRPEGMLASSVVTQRGSVQTRDVEAMGVGWQETWRNLRAGDADVEALLAFLRRHARKGTFLWADHPDAPGMGRAPNGLGEENLIRDAAMDTDTDGDGVVDGWKDADSNGIATFTLDTSTSPNSQKIAISASASSQRADLAQVVLRVFEGDEVTVSFEARAQNVVGSPNVLVALEYRDEDGTFIGGSGRTTDFAGQSSFGRVEATKVAPAGAAEARIFFRFESTASSDAADIWLRNARLLRASSDPATYANPHVSGGSQTGDTLDTAGWPASQSNVVRAGDILRIGGSGETQSAAETDEIIRCFEVAADADSDGSGNATIELDPPILSGNSPADGAALRLTGNRARIYIPSYTMPDASPGNILAQVRARYREAV